jgi:hypothetical protein
MLYTCVTEIICVDSHECNLYSKLWGDQAPGHELQFDLNRVGMGI